MNRYRLNCLATYLVLFVCWYTQRLSCDLSILSQIQLQLLVFIAEFLLSLKEFGCGFMYIFTTVPFCIYSDFSNCTTFLGCCTVTYILVWQHIHLLSQVSMCRMSMHLDEVCHHLNSVRIYHNYKGNNGQLMFKLCLRKLR